MKLKYQFEIMEMDDEFVAVPVGEAADEFHGVVKLNESAHAIFKLLDHETNVETIVEKLSETYTTPADELKAHVEKYVALLQQEGLLA